MSQRCDDAAVAAGRAGWLGVLAGAAGTAAVAVFATSLWSGLAGALALFTLAAVARKSLLGRVARAPAPEPVVAAPAPPLVDDVEQLCRRVLPLWSRHMESVRGQTEEAATSLGSSFAGILERMTAALETSRAASGSGGVAAAIQSGDARLRELVTSLETALHRQGGLARGHCQARLHHQRTQAVAADVAAIASQTNLLALNAAIERRERRGRPRLRRGRRRGAQALQHVRRPGQEDQCHRRRRQRRDARNPRERRQVRQARQRLLAGPRRPWSRCSAPSILRLAISRVEHEPRARERTGADADRAGHRRAAVPGPREPDSQPGGARHGAARRAHRRTRGNTRGRREPCPSTLPPGSPRWSRPIRPPSSAPPTAVMPR